MSQPSCYGLDPEYSEEEFQALEVQRREREIQQHGEEAGADAHHDDADGDGHPDPGPGDRRQHLDWCICGNCEVMPTTRECVCCREIQGCSDITDDCIVDSEEYASVCLTRVVLRVLHVARRDIRGHAHHVPQDLTNKYVKLNLKIC